MSQIIANEFFDAPSDAPVDFQQVIEECNAVLHSDPSRVSAYIKRGDAFMALGDWRGAIADFGAAIALDPRCLAAYRDRAAARFAVKDIKGTIADGEQAIQIDPNCIKAYRIMAEAHFVRGEFHSVVACCNEAIRIDPCCAPAYNTRGGARLILKDYTGAARDCDEALRIDPYFCGAYITRGNARYHQGDMAGVLDYRTAFAIDPALAAKGLIYILEAHTRRDAAEVLADCTKHLQNNPKDVMTYARRGLTLLLQGKDAEAEKDFHQFRLLNPKGTHNLELLIGEARKPRTR